MKRMLSEKKKTPKYYDDKATYSRERAFLIAKWQACLPSSSIRLVALHILMRGL